MDSGLVLRTPRNDAGENRASLRQRSANGRQVASASLLPPCRTYDMLSGARQLTAARAI
ncbi:hypothetical protein BRAS3809_2430033 [Bradyrhizobium sp. STM 3809]|nr:hypothetical protein BRAS3809_2430033 [Bradyrhizobium sp. STM 3809]